MPRMDQPARRILVVLPTWVGDAVMATPTLAALRGRFDQAHITLYGGTMALEVLAGLPLADETRGDTSKGRGTLAALRAGKALRADRFDLAVMLSNAFRVALLCRVGKIRRRVGYARDGRGWLLTDKLEVPRRDDGRPRPTPAIRYYLALAERLGCRSEDRTMHLAVETSFAREAEAMFVDAGIAADRPVVLINPGASFGAAKLWPPERFAAVADALVERHRAQIILNAAPAEKPIAAAVGEAMRARPAISFAERDNTLGLLKAITARCDLMITGDTGPRHVAAALGTGVVTLFGSTDPDWTTIDYDRERIVRIDVPCGPCQEKVCPLPPGPEHHQCMRRITPETVLAAAEELLATTEAAP